MIRIAKERTQAVSALRLAQEDRGLLDFTLELLGISSGLFDTSGVCELIFIANTNTRSYKTALAV